MHRILIGLLFIFLNTKLHVGESVIGLFPDFVGYVLLTRGVSELEEDGAHFGNIRAIAVVMAVYTSALYLVDLLGGVYIFLPVTYVLASISAIFILYRIIGGIAGMEQNWQVPLHAAALQHWWMAVVATQLTALLLSILYVNGVILGIVSSIANGITGIVAILFLVAFHSTETCYREKKHVQEIPFGNSFAVETAEEYR